MPPTPRKRGPSTGAAQTQTSTDPALAAQAAEAASTPRPRDAQGLKRAARAGTIELTAIEEQFLRDEAGFAESEKRSLAQRDEAAAKIAARHPLPAPGSRIERADEHGQPRQEEVGPAGLSLVAFPNQREGDLAPTPEERAKLG